MIDLIVDQTSLIRSSVGGVTGTIYFAVDDECFPANDWSDFPVIILAWWTEAVRKLRTSCSEDLDFMDGPYLIKLELQPGNLVRFDCWAERGKKTLEAAGQVPLERLALMVSEARTAVLETCAQNGWSNPDIAALRAAQDRS